MTLRRSFGLLVGLTIFLAMPVRAADELQPVMPEPVAPRFELTCNSSEFAELQAAASAGILKHGGDMAFHTRVEKQGADTTWVLSIPSPNVLEAWGFWMSERIADLVSGADLDKLDDQTRKELQAAKAAKSKVDACKANPIYDPYSKIGELAEKDGNYILRDGQLEFLLTGDKAKSKPDLLGKSVAVTGFMKAKGQIEVTTVALSRKNTLDLFVMSLCPFGKRAESILVNFMKSSMLPKDSQPTLGIHFIFYKKVEDGKTTYTSLHGEEEILDDLAQIVMRDKYPTVFWDYALKRAEIEGTWDVVASAAGMKAETIEAIKKEITSRRTELIETELAFCESYNVLDGSPTYVWEGLRTTNLDQIPAFKGLNLSQQMCKGK